MKIEKIAENKYYIQNKQGEVYYVEKTPYKQIPITKLNINKYVDSLFTSEGR